MELVAELWALSRWEDPHFQEGHWVLEVLFWTDMNGGWTPREYESGGVESEKTIFST